MRKMPVKQQVMKEYPSGPLLLEESLSAEVAVNNTCFFKITVWEEY